MPQLLWYVLACGVLAVVYGVWASRSILSAPAGNKRMQEIASHIQEGARAYLNRQYTTIGIVGAVIFSVIWGLLGLKVGIGYLIGALLSGAAGYIGMNVSVRANVRTAEAARKSLADGLAISFRSGAVTGMLVAGLALLAVAGYYAVLLYIGVGEREKIDALVALGFGASLISIFARLGGGIFTKVNASVTLVRARLWRAGGGLRCVGLAFHSIGTGRQQADAGNCQPYSRRRPRLLEPPVHNHWHRRCGNILCDLGSTRPQGWNRLLDRRATFRRSRIYRDECLGPRKCSYRRGGA